MTKDDVLKQRGEVFDAAVRLEQARLRIETLNKQLTEARAEYAAAGDALNAQRRTADATEANAVQEATKGEKAIEVRDVRTTLDNEEGIES